MASNVYSSVWESLRVPRRDALRFRFTLRHLFGLMTAFAALFGAAVWLNPFFVVVHRQPVSRACRTQLHAIGQALRAYADDHGCYPPVATYTDSGRPLQSWRAQLLQNDYFPKRLIGYDMNQPWDGPTNKQFHRRAPKLFQCGGDQWETANVTSYFAIVLPDAKPGDPFAVIELHGNQVPFLEPRDVTLAELMEPNTRKNALRVQAAHGTWVHILWPNGDVERVNLSELSTTLVSK